MKTIKTKLALVLAGVIMSSQFAHAIVNPGFEHPTPFSGWTVSHPGLSQVVTNYSAIQGGGQPVDPREYTPAGVLNPFSDTQSIVTNGPAAGTRFARLTSGAQDVWTTISQTFTMGLGDAVVGVAAFDALGASSANDTASLTISSVHGSEILWSRDVSTVNSQYGLGGSSPWEIWTYYTPQGTAHNTAFTLTFRVKNVGSGLNSSVALLDALQIVHVPDNGSTLLMLGGVLIGLFGLSRKLVKA